MAIIADGARDRVEQLLLVTDRLIGLIVEETRRIDAREPPMGGAEAEEKTRLANIYRMELGRIQEDRNLISTAPPELLAKLRKRTEDLNASLGRHEIALNAVKVVAEGLVHAMAEEVVRQRGGGANYNARGATNAPTGPTPAVIDRNA